MLPEGPNSPTVQQQPSVRTAELFPNPASSQVTVIFSQALKMDTPYILRNQLGQVIRQGFFKAGDSTVELDVADLAAGWYVVQPSNGTPPLRFVKQ